MRSSDALALAAILASGCFSPIDLSGRRCPCDEGWTCDEARDRCVQDAVDGGALDAGTGDSGTGDAGAGDSGAGDSGAGDASAFDSGTGDAGTGDAGTGDAGTGDAGSTSSPCPVEARLCDDFESAENDRVPPWEWSTGTAARDTTRALNGAASGHFAIPGGTLIVENSVGIDLPRATTELYVRFHAYVPSTATPQNIALGVLSDGTPPDFLNHSIVVNGASWGTYNSVAGLYVDGAVMPDDTWTCVVFHAVLATSGLLELSVEGNAPVVSRGDTRFRAGPAVFGLGITYVSAEQTMPFDLFYDDVAITLDGTPLTCP